MSEREPNYSCLTARAGYLAVIGLFGIAATCGPTCDSCQDYQSSIDDRIELRIENDPDPDDIRRYRPPSEPGCISFAGIGLFNDSKL